MDMKAYMAFLSAREVAESLLMYHADNSSDYYLRRARQCMAELQEQIALIDGKAEE